MHVSLLMDLDPALLVSGLSEAMHTTREWLTPGMLEELCLGASRSDLAAAEADAAWAYALDYLRRHGKDGHVCRGAMRAVPIVEQPGGEVKRFYPDTVAPVIPDALQAALVAIGGTVRDGLGLIGETTNDRISFVKRDFAAAYGRARRLA